MTFKFLSWFKFQIRTEKIVNIGLTLVRNIHPDKRESTEPDYHWTFKIKREQEAYLAKGKHENSPEVISWKYAVEFSDFFIIVGLMEVIEVEKPEGREEHKGNVDPGVWERGKAEEKLADDFVDYENDLSVWGFPGCNSVSCHSRLKKGHCDHSRDEYEDRSEEHCDAYVNEMCSFETDNIWKKFKSLDTGIVIWRVTVYDC